MRLTLLICLMLLVLPVFLRAEDLAKPQVSAPVDLEADQLDFDQLTGRYHAQGNVRLTQGPLLLTSDRLWWNQQTGEVDARGLVHFIGPGEELSGSRITYDLQQGTGVVEEGEAYWQEKSLRLSGRRIERLGPQNFRLYDGRITLCEGERPAWSLGSKQAEVTIGHYLTARHALVYVKDIPVFYSPYLMIPIKSERESGFLMPILDHSSRRGTEVSIAWYQVLGRNMDATISLDTMSRIGNGVGLEYRYVFPHDQRGEVNAYGVFLREGNNPLAVKWQHLGQISETLRLVADAEFVNDRDYFADFGKVVGEYNEQKVISSLFVNQVWQNLSLTAQYKAIKDLESADSYPWQAAPLVDFSLAPLKLWATPAYFDLQSSYTRFARDAGTTGTRLSLRPGLSLHTYLGAGLEFGLESGYRQNRYFQVDQTLSSAAGSADLAARVSSRAYRVFSGEQSSWLHSIEPEINYLYREENLDPSLPSFDRYDRTDLQNSAGYALVNRLTGKWRNDEGVETEREVLWLKFSQNYALQQPDKSNQFSELRTQLTLRPSTFSSLSMDAYFDVDQGRLPDLSLAGTLADGKGDGLNLGYYRRRPLSGLGEVDNLNVGVNIALLKPLYLGYSQRYDLLQSASLERILTLDLRQQCWGLKTTLRDREDDRSIMFEFTLSGIGSVGKFAQDFNPQ